MKGILRIKKLRIKAILRISATFSDEDYNE